MSFIKRFQTSLESLYHLSDASGPDAASYVVAYSGGVDSHVLLYCCKKLNLPVRAVHVHHGLQTVADDWVVHCKVVCEQLDIKLDVVYVNAHKQSGQSPEEAARNARYAALKDNLAASDCLLTAQHENDQAETLLLQLFRTASTAGLSAMPGFRHFAEAVHVRPLLNFTRTEIENFARENSLLWIEDPSNHDTSLDRNFVRKQVLPGLQERWPEITTQLSNVARLQSNNLQVLEDMAAIDLAASIRPALMQTSLPCRKASIYDVVSVLSIDELQKLTSARLFNVLRYWVTRHWAVNTAVDKTSRISPTRNLLEEIEKVFFYSQPDAKPKINFSGFELRKYQNNLYLLKVNSNKKITNELAWNPMFPLSITALNVRLMATDKPGKGLKQELLGNSLNICFRKGGEKFHPLGRQHSRSLKKLLQETDVPPWDRDVIPLVYFKDELIAVAGLWVSQKYAVAEGETGWDIVVESL